MHKTGRVVIGTIFLIAATVFAGAGLARAAVPPLTFAPNVDYPTGGGWAVAIDVGDFNADGSPDVVTANMFSGVSVLLGFGNGGLRPPTQFSASAEPNSVATGDVNADGHLDLAVASSLDSSVAVLVGDGNGGFGQAVFYSVGERFVDDAGFDVTFGDVNVDGHLDIITADQVISTTSVLLNDGTGAFGDFTRFSTGAGPRSVVAGDVNGDSRPDLVTANRSAGTVSVLLGNGAGSFAANRDFTTGAQPVDAVLGDLNGDGHLDIVTVNYWPSNTVSVLLGNGLGGFSAKTDFVTGAAPNSAALADFDGDGFLDAVTGDLDQEPESVSVLLGDGAGGLGAHTEFTALGNPEHVAAGDFNGDGRADIVSASTLSKVSMLLNSTGVEAVPGAPTILKNAIAHNQSATVSWLGPAWDGNVPLSGYVVTPYVGYLPQTPQVFLSTATTQLITGLTNGKTYRFRVQAVNTIGTGPYSKVTNAVMPAVSVPDAPTIGTATAGDGQATVSWTPPVTDGGSPVVGYVVTAYVGFAPAKTRIYSSTSTTQTFVGLANGTQYRFRVRAYNAVGPGPASKVTNPVTPTV